MDKENDFEEFRKELLKVSVHEKNYRIPSNGITTKKAFRTLSKTNKYVKQVDEYTYSQIVRKVIEYMMEDFLTTGRVDIPYLGSVMLTGQESGCFLKEKHKGVFKSNKLVDWKSTHKLWFEDEECRKKKVLVRFDIPYIYRVLFFKRDFKNKTLFSFLTNRELKRKIYKYIKEEGNPLAFDLKYEQK